MPNVTFFFFSIWNISYLRYHCVQFYTPRHIPYSSILSRSNYDLRNAKCFVAQNVTLVLSFCDWLLWFNGKGIGIRFPFYKDHKANRSTRKSNWLREVTLKKLSSYLFSTISYNCIGAKYDPRLILIDRSFRIERRVERFVYRCTTLGLVDSRLSPGSMCYVVFRVHGQTK